MVTAFLTAAHTWRGAGTSGSGCLSHGAGGGEQNKSISPSTGKISRLLTREAQLPSCRLTCSGG